MNQGTTCPHCGVAVAAGEEFCSECFCDLRVAPSSAAPTQKTIEPAQAKDEAMNAKRDPDEDADEHGTLAASKSLEKTTQIDSADKFRPKLRAPMAVLYIFDDDLGDAERVRLRTPEVTIGRAECDIEIPHDKLMSSKHAQISCRFVDGQYRWYLTDLKSTNRTFLRVSGGKLKQNSELLLGSFRYRFDAAPQGGARHEPDAASQEGKPEPTMGWQGVNQDDLLKTTPSLVRVTMKGETEVFRLAGKDQTIGSNADACDVVIADDPTLSDVHMRVYQDEHRRWHLQDQSSCNGIWVAIDEVEVDKNAQFQIGEQRFSIRFP